MSEFPFAFCCSNAARMAFTASMEEVYIHTLPFSSDLFPVYGLYLRDIAIPALWSK